MKSSVKRKNFYLDEARIHKARRILGTHTETETIHRALDLVTFRRNILRSLEKVRAKGHVTSL